MSEGMSEGMSAAGPYTLIRRLAVGGMGEVFLAEQEGPYFKRLVALKRALPHLAEEEDFVKRLIDEARIMSGLHHGNIIHVHELRQDEWGVYIVMEYLPGADVRALNRALQRRGERWPQALAAWVIKEAALGLEYAHQARDAQGDPLKLIHRDLSPSNILLGREGEVKLIDFGVARAHGSLHQSVAGSLQGKLAYVSPEQARGEPLTQRSDLFSLGVTLFEMLMGRRPFEDEHEATLLARAQRAEHPRLSELSAEASFDAPLDPPLDPALCALVDELLAPRPEERLSGAGELAKRLEAWLSAREGEQVGRLSLKAWLTEHLCPSDSPLNQAPLSQAPLSQAPLSQARPLDPFAQALADVARHLDPAPFEGASASAHTRGAVTVTLSVDARVEVERLERLPAHAEALEDEALEDEALEDEALEGDASVAPHLDGLDGVGDHTRSKLRRARRVALSLALLAALTLTWQLSSYPLSPSTIPSTQPSTSTPHAPDQGLKRAPDQGLERTPDQEEVESEGPSAPRSPTSVTRAVRSKQRAPLETSARYSAPAPRARRVRFELSPAHATLSCTSPLMSAAPPIARAEQGASCVVSAPHHTSQTVKLPARGGLVRVQLKRSATLNARVLPAAAQLSLDGEPLNNPLYRHELSPGTHTLSGSLLVGGQRWEGEERFKVSEGERKSVVLELSAPHP